MKLRGVVFTERDDLTGLDLSGCDLRGADLTRAVGVDQAVAQHLLQQMEHALLDGERQEQVLSIP